MKNIRYYQTLALLLTTSTLTLVSCGTNSKTDDKNNSEQPCEHIIINLGEDILIRECDGYEIEASAGTAGCNYKIKDSSSNEVIFTGRTHEYNCYKATDHEEMLKLEQEMAEDGKIKIYTLK